MGYFQTWTWNARLMRKCKFLAKMWQWLCGVICGHEPSQTEWGYGGGDYADVWCRWCNKLLVIPKSELLFKLSPDKRDLVRTVKPLDNP